MAFRDYYRTLEIVLSFKYLGRLLRATNNDFPEVVVNLWKASKIWFGLDQILGQDGVDTQILERF